jgi:hypothetical protein
LNAQTAAILAVEAERPWFRFPGTQLGYLLVPLNQSPLLRPLVIDGTPTDRGLVLSSVYR